jgi:hypothetical protein
VITGPSFLGLNKPGPGRGPGAPQETALEHLRSSRNLDYLLEDEDEPEPKRGFGKVLLVLVALALALGFGYLRWRQGGFDWLRDAKKSPAGQTADSSQPPADSAASPSSGAPSSPPPSASSPNAGADSAATNPSSPGGTSPAANPAASSPATIPDSGSTNNSAAASTPAPATPAESGATQPKPSDSSAAATPQPDASDAPAKAPDADAPPAKPVRAAKPTPATPVDPVAAAEKYIYGRGVAQDCDRGLRQLKPAAEQFNPKAMISLGALYSTGVCTPRDLPTAYRWFALALRKQPDNESLQQDLQKLWSQMTQPERQLAIKLSQ